jgi:hypothetical protein
LQEFTERTKTTCHVWALSNGSAGSFKKCTTEKNTVYAWQRTSRSRS